MSPDLHVVTVAQLDPRLGRQVVHDPRSRRFTHPVTADTGLLLDPAAVRTFRHRLYGPRPNPSQPIGCCTGVDQSVKGNAVGNRIRGRILTLDDAIAVYSRATELDPWAGSYPPDDTGSSGLAACKAAQEAGIIERYEWIFTGAAGVLTALAGGPGRRGRPVGIGAWWMSGMFTVERETLLVTPAGPRVGGHQWTVTGWDHRLQAFEGLCWWGEWGDRGRFRIRFDHLEQLLADDGDAHVTYRTGTA